MDKNRILKIGRRNQIEIPGRRYNMSKLISESYQTLYSCELDSKLYKLTECHIDDMRVNPEDTERLSKNLEVLKGLSKLGESAKISESDLKALEDENLLEDEEVESPEDEEDVLEEEEELESSEDEELESSEDEEDVLEEDEIPEEEDEILEDEEVPSEEEESITPEELVELKRHLKEIRKARRARESTNCEETPEEEVVDECDHSWKSEKSSMTKALKNFRESSNKKAFYKSFSKLHERMKNPNPLSLEESILLYKASNSAMTHLAVELEHNPEFIYTFRECTQLLAKDNDQLLTCIRRQESPKKSLIESYRAFTNILLESEDLEDDIVEEDEEIVLNPDEEVPVEEPAIEEPVVDNPEEEFEESEEVPTEDEEVPVEESPADEEVPAEEGDELIMEETPEEEAPVEESTVDEEVPAEDVSEDDGDLDDEITDEEARELYNKLAEMRKGKRK